MVYNKVLITIFRNFKENNKSYSKTTNILMTLIILFWFVIVILCSHLFYFVYCEAAGSVCVLCTTSCPCMYELLVTTFGNHCVGDIWCVVLPFDKYLQKLVTWFDLCFHGLSLVMYAATTTNTNDYNIFNYFYI